MSDAILDNPVTEEETYPAPDKIYVKKGRCIYCGSKKIKTLYGYEWCGKPCKLGANALKIYEMEHHLGNYAHGADEIMDVSEDTEEI